MAQQYRRPSGGNKFDNYASSRDVHPLEVDYKKLKVGARTRLRFLDLTDEVALAIEGREVGILNRTNNSMMAIKIEVPVDDNGLPLPEVKDMVDHNGTPILACKKINFFRAPVWQYFEQDENGKITDVDAVRYIEFTQGLRDSLSELEGFQNGVGAFNPETGRPDYDVDLCIIKGEGTIPKNYQFDVVYLDTATKKTHQNFGPEAEDVLEEVMDDIQALWPDVLEAMNTRITLDDFIKRISPPKESRGGAVSSRPGLGRQAPAQKQEAEPETETEGQKAPARPGGRKYGSR